MLPSESWRVVAIPKHPRRMPRGNRPTLTEQAERMQFIEEAYVRLMSRDATVRYVKKEKGLGYRTTDSYLQKIRRRWNLEDERERPRLKQSLRRSTIHRINAAEAAGKHSAVLAGLKFLAELDGLLAPEQHVHTVEVRDDLSKLPVEDLHALDRIRRTLDEEDAPEGNGKDRVH